MKIFKLINKRFGNNFKIFNDNEYKNYLTNDEIIICYLEMILQKIEEK